MSELDLAIEVRCQRTIALATEKKAINLCLVIDRSGSMRGIKLETAKKSCVEIYRRLRQEDLFTAVTFGQTAEVVVNPDTPSDEVLQRIQSIQAEGKTNLSLGWYQGLLELQSHMTDAHFNRAFLLSDGAANLGETRVTALASAAARSRDLGINTTTIGIGDDFEENVLDAIASGSGGRFWYIAESRIEEILDQELRGLLMTLIDRPRIELVLSPGVAISRELNSLRRAGDKYRLRPLKSQDTFSFAVRLEVDPAATAGDRIELVANLFDDVTLLATTTRAIPLAPQSKVVTTGLDPLVASIVEQFEMTTTDEQAVEGIASGDMTQMRRILTDQVTSMQRVLSDLDRRQAIASFAEAGRLAGETLNTGSVLAVKQASLTIVEIVEEYIDTPEVQRFLNLWAKHMRMANHRVHGGWNELTSFDKDSAISLHLEAIALCDQMAQRFPERARQIAVQREELSENLARFQ